MTNTFKNIDEKQTVYEHSKIINNYKELGQIDRDDAIKKYNDFNRKHPDYYSNLNFVTSISNTKINITETDNNTLIANLESQLLWLLGK